MPRGGSEREKKWWRVRREYPIGMETFDAKKNKKLILTKIKFDLKLFRREWAEISYSDNSLLLCNYKNKQKSAPLPVSLNYSSKEHGDGLY